MTQNQPSASISPDIRWLQRFSNFGKALAQLEDAVQLARERPLSNLEKQGLIQGFEFTHELAWNVMRDYLAWQGTSGIAGSRDASREFFNRGLIEDGEGWLEMIVSRNQTSHTYNEEVANAIAERILTTYQPLFKHFAAQMQQLAAKT